MFLTAAAVITVVFLLSYLSNINEALSSSRDGNMFFHQTFFQPLLGISGAIISGKFFADQLIKEKGYSYLLLPSTNLEKYVSGVLITGIGYTIFTLIFYYILANVSDAITNVLVGRQIFEPFTFDPNLVWNSFRVYMNINALFLLGGLIYHKNPVIKTIAVCFGIFVGLTLVFGLTMKLVFWEYIGWEDSYIPQPTQAFKDRMENLFNGDLLDIGLLLGPVFLWVTGFFRLKEQEA